MSSKNYDNLSELGNAKRLVKYHGDRLRWVKEWGWMVWDSRRWQLDKRGRLERAAKDTVGRIYQEAAQAALDGDEEGRTALAKFALKSEERKSINAMIDLAKSEEGIAVGPEQFDRDPYLLSVLNGTLDLRTGKLREHNREDLITKLVPVEYDPTADCSIWLSFLTRIMDNNPELIGFLKRALGYSLTGLTTEQVMFLLWGSGQNGKSTFLETIQALLGDYSKTTNPAAFLAKEGNSDSPRNDIAALAGARFVKAVESEKGRRWAEALLKEVTGGDTISARFLYRDEFSFKPAFKLWFAANHKPKVIGQDLGIWRRIRLIPFDVTISDSEKDKNLPDKLRAELPGILAWVVEGCLEWQAEGLKEPQEVLQATESYKAESDMLRDFIADSCFKGRANKYKVLLNVLYNTYTRYCGDNGERAMSKANFSQALQERGFSVGPGAKNKTTVFGLALLEKDHIDNPATVEFWDAE